LSEAVAVHPERRINLWFMDEARRPKGLRLLSLVAGDRPSDDVCGRYDWAWIFATVRRAGGDAFALVLPKGFEAMQAFLGSAGAMPDFG
jgi:hypothetical protein